MTNGRPKSLIFALGALLMPALACAEVRIDGAWVRAMPPNQKMTAAYATLHNTGEIPVTVTGASSPIAGAAELHTTVKSGDSMRMVPLEPVSIAPGERFTFAPGGPHVMLMGVADMPAANTEVSLCFVISESESHCTEAPVQRSPSGANQGHKHH